MTAYSAQAVQTVLPKPAPPIDVSVVIIGWNTCDLVLQAIASVVNTTKAHTYEVIYVDNASQDQTVKAVGDQFPDTVIIANQDNRGFVKGNNQGLALARGRYFVLLNSDAQLLDGTLDRSLTHMDHHPEVGIVGCEMLNTDRSFQAGYWDFPTLKYQLTCLTGTVAQDFKRWKSSYSSKPAVRDVDWISGAYMVLRRAAIEQTGMMDERIFMYSEEIDLCLRVKKAGWKIHYLSDVQVVHHHRASSVKRSVRPFQAHAIRSQQILFWTHYPGWQALLLMVLSLGVGLGMIVKGVFLFHETWEARTVRIRNGLECLFYCFETLTLRTPRIPQLPPIQS